MENYLLTDEANAWTRGLPHFGFGLMRLPQTADGVIDVEQVKIMVDLFRQAGMKYFDTAWAYPGSEEAIGAALVQRYPRDSFFLVDKLNAWQAEDEAAARDQINVSLKRSGAGYFDMYFLHAIMDSNVHLYDDWHLWDYQRELKEKGLIRHCGFSFHGTPELLDRLLTEHPDIELVQLQLNYADWENPAVQSRRNLEVCQKHHKPVTVMEPVKGGYLANPPKSIRDYFTSEDPQASYAQWAIRFAASQPGVITVLSGMSNVEQMKDNLSYMTDFKPLDAHEQEVIRHAQELLAQADSIPCTACHYCMPGCPVGMPIPDIFEYVNIVKLFDQRDTAQRRYGRLKTKASQCLQCGQCEGACPQHLPIIRYLQEAAKMFES
jgi:predicted aldo/keto reductase-like oxidoreductase